MQFSASTREMLLPMSSFGFKKSKTFAVAKRYVRFAPKSGHCVVFEECPLWSHKRLQTRTPVTLVYKL